MKPSVGRIVHFVSYGQENPHRAAIVTAIDPEGLSLCILMPTGMFFATGITEDPTGEVVTTWHWPEIVQ